MSLDRSTSSRALPPVPSKDKITVRTIAEQSGWSVGTVSRVLNGAGGVSDKAAADITRVIRRLGYRRNESASVLRQKHPSGILILVRNICSRYKALAQHFEQALQARSMPVHLIYLDDEQAEEGGALENGGEESGEMDQVQRLYALYNPSLIVLIGIHREELLRKYGRISVPAIVVSAQMSDFDRPNWMQFYSPDTEIALQGTETLFASGCRSIGVLCPPRKSASEIEDRILGVQYAFYSRDQVLRSQERVQVCENSMQAGFEGFELLIHKVPDLDGLLVFEPEQAIGALRKAADLGYRIPEDLKVFCLEDAEMLRYSLIGISAAKRDTQQEDELLMNACMKLTDSAVTGCRNRKIELPWSMIYRQSCPRPE